MLLIKKNFKTYLAIAVIFVNMLNLNGMEEAALGCNQEPKTKNAYELATEFKQYLEDTIVKMEFSGVNPNFYELLVPFYADEEPEVTISEYFDHINKFFNLSPIQIIRAQKYVERFIIEAGLFIGNNISLTIQRIVFTSVILAIKYDNRETYDKMHSEYATYGEMSEDILQNWENNFRIIIESNFTITREELDNATKIPQPIQEYWQINGNETIILDGVKNYLLTQLEESRTKKSEYNTVQARMTDRLFGAFGSQTVPTTSFSIYFDRLTKLSAFFSTEDFVVAYIYIKKLINLGNFHQISVVNELSIHRLFFATLVSTNKYLLEDCTPTGHYRVLGGITKAEELVSLTICIYYLLGFQLYISAQEWNTAVAELLELGK